MEDSSTFKLKLPGFRFHPTEEELLSFYLRKMIFQKEPRVNVIGFLNIYRHDPWDLPGLAKTQIGEREWYFFVPRDRKNGNGGRPNRTTEKGFWKATGSDRKVISLSDPKKMIGLKKTLVFYKGRAPRGCKTDWIMNEFRLPDTCPSPKDIVLCKIYRKATSLKALEQRATTEEVPSKTSPMLLSPPITRTPSPSSLDDGHQFYSDTLYRKETSLKALEQRATMEEVPSKTSPMLLSPPITRTPSPSSLDDGHQFYSDTHHHHYQYINGQLNILSDCRVKGASDIHSLTFDSRDTISKARVALKEEKMEQVVEEDDLFLFGIQNKKIAETKTNTSIQLPFGQEKLPELLVSKSSVDWTQDPFWTQLRSPWLDDWAFYANALNF